MAKEVVLKRGEAEVKEEAKNGQAELAAKQAQLEARHGQLAAKLESLTQRRAQASLELAGPQNFWDIFAVGPYQDPALQPSRVIEVNEQATIRTYVYLNPFFPLPYPGQNACDIITGFGASIELNYITSNLQTMQPVPELSYSYCIPTTPGQCWYWHDWVFTPQRSACIYETNICCRICNCNNRYIQQYSGFARWIQDLDYDLVFGSPGLTFDQPIRFMVSDYRLGCENCPPYP
jgi:hypothetical protein